MATKTAPATKIDPPIGVAFDANTGKAVTLGMDVYPAGWTVYEANAQWHLGYLGDLSKVWRDYTGKGVSVGVYDQGVESAHWDLAANIDKSKELVDDNGNVLSGEPVFTSDDLHDGAHGTSCAGLIAAARNGRGGVGVAHLDARVPRFQPDRGAVRPAPRHPVEGERLGGLRARRPVPRDEVRRRAPRSEGGADAQHRRHRAERRHRRHNAQGRTTGRHDRKRGVVGVTRPRAAPRLRLKEGRDA